MLYCSLFPICRESRVCMDGGNSPNIIHLRLMQNSLLFWKHAHQFSPSFYFPMPLAVVGSNLVDALSMSEQATSYDASTTKILKKITRQKMPISKGGIKGNLFLSAASFVYLLLCFTEPSHLMWNIFEALEKLNHAFTKWLHKSQCYQQLYCLKKFSI